MKKATIYCLLSIAGLFIMDWIYPQTPVFINEFHYDNAGADVNEGVEVAGPGKDYTLHIDTASPSSNYELFFLAADHANPPNTMVTAVMLQVRTAGDTKLRLDSPMTRDTILCRG